MPVAVRVDTTGLRDLAGRFHRATPERSGRFRDGMQAIGKDVAARAKAAAPRRTGKLAGSVGYRTDGGGASWKLTVFVGVPYGLFVIKGTRPHAIYPRKAKRLRFVVGGRTVFAKRVMHPGTRANPFIEDAVRSVDLHARMAKIADQVAVDITR